MRTMQEAAEDFLAQRRVAVAGVSRDSRQPANAIYRRLREGGRQVYAVNPMAETLEGDPCYPRLSAIQSEVDAVVIATRPEAAEQIVRECVKLGIRRVWMHRGIGQGSVSAVATQIGRSAGITVIDGACPLMYIEPIDFFHRCGRWFMGITGRLPHPDRP